MGILKRFFASSGGSTLLVALGSVSLTAGIMAAGTMMVSFIALSVGGFFMGLPISGWATRKVRARREAKRRSIGR